MNARPLVIIGLVVLLLILAYVAYSKMEQNESPTATTTTMGTGATTTPDTAATSGATGATATGGTSGTPQRVTITYGPNGFSPANVTIPVGSTVTWVNQGGGNMWVASAQHPSHTVYDGSSTSQHCSGGAPSSSTVFDQCSTGSSFSFTFTKAGSWGYHNHADASDHGMITVTP
jgi:plastocyanin